MSRKLLLAIAIPLLASVAALVTYLLRLKTEAQCAAANGSIDVEGRVCIIRGVAHPLQEAAVRTLIFWVVVSVVGAAAIIAWRSARSSHGAA